LAIAALIARVKDKLRPYPFETPNEVQLPVTIGDFVIACENLPKHAVHTDMSLSINVYENRVLNLIIGVVQTIRKQ